MLKKFDKQSLLFSFLSDFVLIYPFYNLMFKHAGISPTGMSLLLVVMQVAKMAFDIPSGLMADIYGRKFLLILAQILRAVFMLMWAIFPTYPSFLMGMAIWGISMSCIYGNLEAYVYDELKIEGRDVRQFSLFMSRYYTVQNIAIAIGSAIAGYFLDKGGYAMILIISAASILLSALVSMALPNKYFQNNTSKRKMAELENNVSFSHALGLFFQHPSIKFYAFLSAINDGVFVFFIDINTTLMANGHFSPTNISAIVALVAFSRIVANFVAGYTVTYFNPKISLTIMMALFCQIGLSAATNNLYPVIVGVVIYLIIYALIDISVKARIQQYIESEVRATIMSIASLMISLFVIFMNGLNALISHKFAHFSSPLQINLFAISVDSVVLLTISLILAHKFYKMKKHA